MGKEDTEHGPLSPTIGAFESLQSHSNSIRRARPPDIVIAEEDRVPLRVDSRQEKINKRESRVGLRGLFGRQKTGSDKDGQDPDGSAARRESPRLGSIRASLAEISNWPYGLHSSRSDLSLASPQPPSSSRSNASGLQSQPSIPRLRQSGVGKSKPLPAAPSPNSSSWVPLPLFQVYPQSVKHATLPACTASLDVLLRLNGHRNSGSTGAGDDAAGEEIGEKKGDKIKKFHQRTGGSRSILEWTTKTYVLNTSGYLLQYSADGSFDRLPERVLRLTKDSAAFASDLIPGKHWVIQVVSTVDTDGAPTGDNRSLFSKLALRAAERRTTSNFLMVFESAEDMDNWLAVLRREIEELGGKKRLSETGEPKTEDHTLNLKTQPSQRTIVVRDPARFSTIVQQDFSWTNENALKEQDHDHGLPAIPSAELTPEFSLDDISTTESHYSSDGQHLDSLRDSSNRFSYISSGQRTYVTSANSSPACSPTRASFSSHNEGVKTNSQAQESQTEVRLRPNAQAISSRRQSMQTLIPSLETQFESSARPHSFISTGGESNDSNASNRQSVPNFSKRFSGFRPPSLDSVSDQVESQEQPEPSVKACRKPPPTSLAMSRPLSTVVDMPSPRSPLSPQEAMRSINAMQRQSLVAPAVPDSSAFSKWKRDEVRTPPQRELPSVAEATSTVTNDRGAQAKISPRRFVSLNNLRAPADSFTDPESKTQQFVLSSTSGQQDNPTWAPSMGSNGLEKRLAATANTKAPSYKRATFLAEDSSSRCSPIPVDKALLTEKASKRQSRSPLLSSSNQFLNVDLRAKALLGRRSMPQLAEGPPLAPPPTRALPPLPKKS
ncbi:uncharacterized protein JN550_001294 [Neoarthrinium moseri]|uniref:uncharacterized protein n=1 Tax=Neoarthrinium moseri TaxID=1658444 RepID=UPI001FDD44F7|nr:uncharacterized protein JN550_001294 [Neoarthrinium moseri]KAI1877222.1 hypothetical protein JN550_001294 [Neoarthrinium moseri]